MEQIVLKKLYDLSYIMRVKEYENDVRELESFVATYIKHLERLKKLVACMRNGLPLDKQSLSTGEVEKLKIKLVAEIGEIPAESLTSFAKSTKSKTKEKEPKKSTYELSFELWQKSKSIEEVANIRKLTFQTISGHLLKYVEKGEIEVEELIDLEKLKLIYKKLNGKNDFESLTQMRSYLNDEFGFDELRLYKIWVSKNG